ncbi:hypothetical protein PVBG_06310 [Plasmodium vivax Brazil I]|uniref:VIR protein n=1 Tax=Plasmodium vivax (strain Brazil I) TaxID=1033975 RepID=A0A0J9T1N8_PLAV1|nr:hypothetical protein PVBG_06310 [Plasmodium vivax Brazil I]
MLKKEYTIPNTKERSPWCNESSISLTTIYPREFTPLNCDETISREPISKDSCPPSVPAKCECESPETAFPVIPSLPDQPSEKDPTKNIAVTSGFTAAGTLGTLFFLYRFTPMSSWLRRRGMNNVGTDLYMDPGAAESFLRMQHDNGGNNLFYHPSV